MNLEKYNYRGLLILFPIDMKYQFVIEKYFNIYKKLEISNNNFKDILENIFNFEINYPKNLIKNKSLENSKGDKMIIYIIIDKSVGFVNEKKKKLARREIDNLRFINTNIYRKTLPLQNHFHTTDDSITAINIINYLNEKNIISNIERIEYCNFLEGDNKNKENIIMNDKKLLNFDKIIIWGHKLYSHTHSYIHYGFFKAFKYLGYDVYWFDDDEKINNFDFKNSLFLTEHQVNKKIPIRNDCKYILHNSYLDEGKSYYLDNTGSWEDKRFIDLAKNGNVINIQVYKTDFVKNKVKMNDYIYYSKSNYTLYMPWATDLLPYEIEINKDKLINLKKNSNKIIYIIGTYEGEYKDTAKKFVDVAKQNNIKFVNFGGFYKKKITPEDNCKLIMESYLSPAIQPTDQVNLGYIPCRIFKNISYGQLGITNSKVVSELFNNEIVYNEDSYKLFYDAEDFLKKKYNLKYQFKMMDFVKNKHTYLNRIESLFKFFDILKE